MNEPPIKTYSMAQVAALTGISAHTLRKWESRYSFIKPLRSDTNIRAYSEQQLKLLLLISILTKSGIRISAIDTMSLAEIHQKAAELEDFGSFQTEIKALTVSMLDLDEVKFSAILQQEIIRNGLLDTVQELLYPFLNHVGILWGTNQAMPAQEHFISNIIRQKIFAAIDQLPDASATAKRLVLFLPAQEQHEIGLLIGSYIARKLGWKVYYLGQNVPFENLHEILRLTEPDLMMTLLISPLTIETLDGFSFLLHTTACPLVYAGLKLPIDLDHCTSTVTHLEKPSELLPFLQAFKAK